MGSLDLTLHSTTHQSPWERRREQQVRICTKRTINTTVVVGAITPSLEETAKGLERSRYFLIMFQTQRKRTSREWRKWKRKRRRGAPTPTPKVTVRSSKQQCN